ncbi:MAG: GNAT family N-acetyltransferase [Clostridiales bacterium]|nr:GNAT family N-acetyltransferase [Clostridiales bacterium]
MSLIIKHFSELTTRELYEILKTRQEIFVVEQNCPYMDIDDLDLDATHIFAQDEATGRVTGCLRVFVRDPEQGVAQIGRVVTLVHGQGLGGELLHAGVHFAFHNLRAEKIYLHAQTYATGYYEKEGFRVVSEEFMEDGIPHVEMECVREER